MTQPRIEIAATDIIQVLADQVGDLSRQLAIMTVRAQVAERMVRALEENVQSN